MVVRFFYFGCMDLKMYFIFVLCYEMYMYWIDGLYNFCFLCLICNKIFWYLNIFIVYYF